MTVLLFLWKRNGEKREKEQKKRQKNSQNGKKQLIFCKHDVSYFREDVTRTSFFETRNKRETHGNFQF